MFKNYTLRLVKSYSKIFISTCVHRNKSNPDKCTQNACKGFISNDVLKNVLGFIFQVVKIEMCTKTFFPTSLLKW